MKVTRPSRCTFGRRADRWLRFVYQGRLFGIRLSAIARIGEA